MNWVIFHRPSATQIGKGTNGKQHSSHRGGRRGNADQQGGLQRQNTGPRDGNTTPQQSRRGGVGRGLPQAKHPENSPNGPPVTNRTESKRPDTAAGVAQEEHIPVNDFNAQELRAGLKKASEVKPAVYKAVEKAAPPVRSGSPWASKRMYGYSKHLMHRLTRPANMTAGGRDFFVELRKQVAALQQGGGTTLGG